MAEYDNDTPAAGGEQKPEVAPETKAAVEKWCKKVREARAHWDKRAFKQMRENMQFARDGASKEWVSANRFTVPIINRHINQAVSQLYARNPKVLAKRKPRRMHSVWDGTSASLLEASAAVTGAMQTANAATSAGLPPAPPDPNAVAILSDAMQVKQYNKMLDGISETLTLLLNHYMSDKASQHKQHLKSLVRRVKVCCVGYVKLGMQRILEKNPDVTAKVADATEQIAHIERLLKEQAEGEIEETSAKLEELKTMMADLQSQETLVVQEGPIWTYPAATSIIIDPECRHLKTLTGARWVAEEFCLPPDRVEEIYGVDIGKEYKPYSEVSGKPKPDNAEEKAVVWRVMCRDTGQEFTICDGYCNWLRPPALPQVRLTRFFDIFPLVFNEVEDEDGDIFPPSDVRQAKHIQEEYNRSREGLRQHRMQNKPAYITPAAALSDTDKRRLQEHESGEIIELVQLVEGSKVQDKIMAKPTVPIDPALYEVEQLYADLQRVVGSQQANLGGTSGDTATESSIAEQSRTVAMSDNVDDLDDFLSLLTDSTAELMLRELSLETVQRIVGPGAVWPSDVETREELIEDISIDIRAGSSGRPNQAAEVAKMERAMPFIVQMPGVNPVPITERYLDLLEIDAESAIVEGLPSVVAMNAMASRPPAPAAAPGQSQPGTGDPASDPASQGASGAQNAPAAGQNEPQSQPAYPEPAPTGI